MKDVMDFKPNKGVYMIILPKNPTIVISRSLYLPFKSQLKILKIFSHLIEKFVIKLGIPIKILL